MRNRYLPPMWLQSVSRQTRLAGCWEPESPPLFFKQMKMQLVETLPPWLIGSIVVQRSPYCLRLIASLSNDKTELQWKRDAAEIQLNICFDKLQRESFCRRESGATKWFFFGSSSLFEADTLPGRVGFSFSFSKSCKVGRCFHCGWLRQRLIISFVGFHPVILFFLHFCKQTLLS